MFVFVDLEPILKNQFCILGGSAQFRTLIDVARSQHGTGQALQAVLQFSDSLHDLGRGRLRLDVAIECDFALDLLNVLGDSGFAVVYWMDDLRNDASQWIGIRHGTDYKAEIRQVEDCQTRWRVRVPHPFPVLGKGAGFDFAFFLLV
jgi:hypothetical protein